MNVAFLADIHGNYKALRSVIDNLNNRNIKRIYFLGDYVNYYTNPDKCIDLIKSLNAVYIKGNHEQIILDILSKKVNIKKFNNKYNNTVKITLKKLKKHHIVFIKKMREKKIIQINNSKILIAHGSPWNPNYYCYQNKLKNWENKIKKYKQKIILLAHTHIKMKIKLKDKIILNPGSVGQPRDGSVGASWLEYNTIKKKIYIQKYQLLK